MQRNRSLFDTLLRLDRNSTDPQKLAISGLISPHSGFAPFAPFAPAARRAAGRGAARQAVRGSWPGLRWEATLDQEGRIIRKQEHACGRLVEFAYAYDAGGRLAAVWRNGRKAEEYGYNEKGQRVTDWTDGQGRRSLAYDSRGRLVRAGGDVFYYAQDGTLRCRDRQKKGLYLTYGQNRGLAQVDSVALGQVDCETNRFGQPLRKRQAGALLESFAWLDLLRLGRYENHERGYALHFLYRDGQRLPVSAYFDHPDDGRSQVWFGFDQVGTLKAVTGANGEAIKTIDCDSFGRVLSDSWPWFFAPVGFAGGCRDRHTGFVRFGHRDYDPEVGRFVSCDPLGDTGGDHDLYEYCVDDPVNAVDPEGLEGQERDGASGNRSSDAQDREQREQVEQKSETQQPDAQSKGVNPFGGVQVGGTLHIGGVGLTGSHGKLVDSNGRVCTNTTGCARFGPGVYIGGGVQGTAGVNPSSGLSIGLGGDLGYGVAGVGGAITGNTDGVTGSVDVPYLGAGFGLSGGLDICYSKTECEEKENDGKDKKAK